MNKHRTTIPCPPDCLRPCCYDIPALKKKLERDMEVMKSFLDWDRDL